MSPKRKSLEEIVQCLVHKHRPSTKKYSKRRIIPTNDSATAVNMKYAVKTGDVGGIDGLLGALEYARINRESLNDMDEIKVDPIDISKEDHIIQLSRALQQFLPVRKSIEGTLAAAQRYYDKYIGDCRISFYVYYAPSAKRHKNIRIFMAPFNEQYKYNLSIYKDKFGKYHILKNIGRFFRSHRPLSYCMECNCYYRDTVLNKHNVKCPVRCPSCLRIDPKHGRCKEDKPVSCVECYKTFNNRDCFEYHIKHKLCKNSFRCLDCDKVVGMDGFRERRLKFTKTYHECGEKVCRVCYSYHHPLSKHHNESYC